MSQHCGLCFGAFFAAVGAEEQTDTQTQSPADAPESVQNR